MSKPPAQPDRSGFTPGRFGLLLALLVLAMFPQVILGVETFVARDFGFFVYPLAHFQKDCFWHGELPLWNPYNNCGVPFLAQWNTMPLYPPALIYLTLPLEWSMSFFSLAHLWFAGLGMFFLARRWTGNSFAATFAGAVFAFNGFTLNLLMWPSHIATFSWMPWVVLAVEGAWREGGRRIPLAALAGAMQMLAGGPETIFITWLIVLAFWLQQFIYGQTNRVLMLWRFPVVVGLVVALSAAQLLPFLDLVAHAQRATGYTDLRWSMPGSGLANFLVPMAFGSTATEGIFFQHGQYWTSSYYLGIGTLWLALLAVICVRKRRTALLTIMATLALLCALGEHTPFYPLVRKLIPQLSFITYPVKFVMVVIFSAPLLAAFALANFQKKSPANLNQASGAPVSDPARTDGPQRAGSEAGVPGRQSMGGIRKWFLPIGLILLVLTGAIVIWTQASPMADDEAHPALLNGLSRMAFLVITGVILFALAREMKSPLLRFLQFALIMVACLDVFTHEPKQNPTVPPGVYQLNLARTELAMNPQPSLGGSRAMLSPSAALDLTRFAVTDPKNNFLAKRLGYCANVNLLDAVPKVDGFYSLTPRDFDSLLSLVYSVTNGNWAGLEDFMGVSQYTSETNILAWRPRTNFLPLITAGQRPVFLDDTNTLWTFGRNEVDPLRTVFLPPEAKSSVTAAYSPTAKILNPKFTNRTVDFEILAATPTLAVIAQTYYHNWHAEIDGQPAPLLRANVAFQAVQVLPGTHRVHLFYQDRAFETGAAISICAWIVCIFGCFALRRGHSKA
ncbi:MAG TPA: hypothetical protein VH251_09710 [Verrucomicrobiae bacterium]|nr:hypothetical protein [Verrucomicrobiae bacterium]